MTGPWLIVVTILLVLLGNGFFSGSEIALISVKRSKIESLIQQGSRGARRVKELQDDPDTFLATVQIGVTLMGTLAGVLGGYLASRYVEPVFARTWLGGFLSPSVLAGGLVGAGIVYVELILGELVPKALALRFTETMAVAVGRPIRFLAGASRWGIAFLTASTRAVLRLFGIRDPGSRTFVSQEEIKHLVQEGREQG